MTKHNSILLIKYFLNHPIGRFIIIGSLAACTHLTLMIIFVSGLHFPPLPANIVAFLLAFFVSFFGHRHWTFHTQTNMLTTSMWRFFAVACFSFALNQSLFYLLLVPLHFYYLFALIIVLLAVPPITFSLSKLWAFAA